MKSKLENGEVITHHCCHKEGCHEECKMGCEFTHNPPLFDLKQEFIKKYGSEFWYDDADMPDNNPMFSARVNDVFAFITNALNQQRETLIEKILDYRQEDGKHLIARNSPFGEFLTKLEK